MFKPANMIIVSFREIKPRRWKFMQYDVGSSSCNASKFHVVRADELQSGAFLCLLQNSFEVRVCRWAHVPSRHFCTTR
jgi:hypothetical protein